MEDRGLILFSKLKLGRGAGAGERGSRITIRARVGSRCPPDPCFKVQILPLHRDTQASCPTRQFPKCNPSLPIGTRQPRGICAIHMMENRCSVSLSCSCVVPRCEPARGLCSWFQGDGHAKESDSVLLSVWPPSSPRSHRWTWPVDMAPTRLHPKSTLTPSPPTNHRARLGQTNRAPR